MKAINFILAIGVFFNLFSAQENLSGTWQGVVIQAGQSIDQGTLLYVDFKINDGILSGHMREELYETEFYSLKQINGTSKANKIKFKQLVVEKSKKTSRQKWCRFSGNLTYDETTGYLTGKYESYDCKRVIGEIILYRSDFELKKDDNMELSHIWFDRFVSDFKEGLSAPAIREIERKNFVFEPVYFDFDKSEIRSEHFAFLDRLIKVVKGHSDLRVKVVGHTDSDGSDGYNVELSKARAESIILYFTQHGLSRDRLEFDFKGEKAPVDTNATPEGKQRNRRVDFSFI